MAKVTSLYGERERLIKLQSLASFNINPMAAMLVFEAYAADVAPLPVKFVWEPNTRDKIQDGKASKRLVEIYIKTAGYNGKRQGNPEKCDRLALILLAMSYYRDLRPMPVIFQMANAVEFALITPGYSHLKNPLRDMPKGSDA